MNADGYAFTDDGGIIVPPGDYWLGDPCYPIPSDEWQAWVDSMYSGQMAYDAPFLFGLTPAGHPVVAMSTGGDGVYIDQHGTRYPVDAGLIGLVRVECFPHYDGTAPQARLRLSWRVRFDTAVECRDLDGVLAFGDHRITVRRWAR